jgi:hypothetical protein
VSGCHFGFLRRARVRRQSEGEGKDNSWVLHGRGGRKRNGNGVWVGRREKGEEGRREKKGEGEGRREKGEGRREKGEGRREKGEGRRETYGFTEIHGKLWDRG